MSKRYERMHPPSTSEDCDIDCFEASIYVGFTTCRHGLTAKQMQERVKERAKQAAKL